MFATKGNTSLSSVATDQDSDRYSFNMGGNAMGADLKYTDDQLSSYSDIFDNAETKVTEEDEQRVVTALKNLAGMARMVAFGALVIPFGKH